MVKASLPSQIQSLLNAAIMFNLMKILAQLKQFKVSEIKGKKYQFLTVMTFRPQ